MKSVWRKGKKLPDFPRLDGNQKTDVLIIGGGMARILCAHFLQEMGIDYMLVERSTICSGVTENTTAKITAQHGLLYHKLLKGAGRERAQLVLDANLRARDKYAELCQNIDCDFEERTSYVYSTDNRKKLEQEAEALDKLGHPVSLVPTEELPFPTVGALAFEGQAQFHPLRFAAQIAADLKIYEHTFVTELKENTAVTNRGEIAFEKLIIATHFPMDNKHGMYFMKMYQHRSYVIALRNAACIKGMYVDEKRTGLSFRSYRDFLLVGGGSHRTGKKGGCWQELRDFAKSCYPSPSETYHWATQDCMTLDGIPYIGKYSKNMPHCFVAAGFNKWGMTSSMTAAMILADLVSGKENAYAQVFSPSRSMWKPQLFLNGCEALVNLLSPARKRCPHMGCSLKWNGVEHSWDCPCHGSRFDEQGRLLDNPANGNLGKRRE